MAAYSPTAPPCAASESPEEIAYDVQPIVRSKILVSKGGQQTIRLGLQMRSICACRGLGSSLQRKREYLQKQLEDVGFRVLPAQGTYFLVADIR